MNLQQLNSLSDNELRIKVVEALGWRNIVPIDNALCDLSVIGLGFTAIPKHDDGFGYRILLDYPNDLNACAEFERDMTEIQFCKYCMILCGHTTKGEKIEWSGYDVAKAVRATARQRCIAFLLTVGTHNEN